VQTGVALPLPDDDRAGWDWLKGHVRRCHEPDDGRLLIDDSKKVYAAAHGFARLEAAVYAAFRPTECTVGRFVADHTPNGCPDDLRQEAWYNPAEPWPVGGENPFRQPAVDAWFSGPVVQRVRMYNAAVLLTPPPRFNRLVAEHGSKGTVLALGLTTLLRDVHRLGNCGIVGHADTPVHVLCDKLGGRNFYAPLLQAAYPDGWVIAEKESAAESRYRVMNLGREVTVTFRPRADADSVPVALASMLAKYLREVCMRQFNAFWAAHVPGIRPTAGYPVDAKRFYAEIRPAMERLGIPPEAVWRYK
jgi:hypothetical protein